jgi:NitT/TauT family transport system substrate-binding protein
MTSPCDRGVITVKRALSLLAAATLALVFSLALSAAQGRAQPLQTLRVGKAVPEAFTFTPLDIGMRKGFFKENGLDIQETAFAGDAKMQQAIAADGIDIGIGSGPALAFIVKGSPVKGVAEMAGPPLLLAIVVRPDGPKTAADLKGKKVSVSTAGSLTYWLVSHTARRQGWGADGIQIQPMGAMAGQIAALRRGDIDGVIMDIANALDLEKKGDGRILVRFNDLQDFVTHVIFAADKLIATRPDSIRGFLKGWFETIAFMRADKAATVAIAAQVLQKDLDIMSRTYDDVIPMFSDNGRFNPKGLAVLAQSFVDLHTLPAEPDMSKLYTEAFLPAVSK